MKKGAIKPRNEPYDISGLTFHDGMVAVMVDMRKPDLPFTVPIGEVPLASKAVFSQLKHELCGETAWMRSPEDVKGVFSDSYTAGELEDYTKNMSISTFSLPWPPIAAHLGNLDMDMGAPLSSLVGAGWRLEGVHLQPGPAGARARIAGTCAVLCLARERDARTLVRERDNERGPGKRPRGRAAQQPGYGWMAPGGCALAAGTRIGARTHIFLARAQCDLTTHTADVVVSFVCRLAGLAGGAGPHERVRSGRARGDSGAH